MEPETLARQVRARGLVILAVTRHRSAEDVLVVYLHGNAGQWANDTAAGLVADVPGVVAVAQTVQTPSILLVRVVC